MPDKTSSHDRDNASTYTTLAASEHPINHEDISPGALKIIQILEQAGYQASLVGGGVRDLLVGGHPKDFDIATDATPEQVKQLFRRARIVGRRFRIVHVRMGREVIEVTTFRAHHSNGSGKESLSSAEGMLLRDNVYGDIHSDAVRRDFTMNALYYSPSAEAITDFTGGVEDIDRKQVRMIGDPVTRYQEDPVRMLRAVRLAAKLGFDIEPDTARPIGELGELLGNVAPARLFDETLKMLMAGHAEVTCQSLREHGLFPHLFPATDELLSLQAQGRLDTAISLQGLIRQAVHNTDQRIRRQQRVTPAFLLAVILWPVVEQHQRQLMADGVPPAPALSQGAQMALSRQVQRIAIPKRFTFTMRDIWELQNRLPRRAGQQAFRLMQHPKFRAAYDFLLLREEAGEDTQGLGQWWTRFQTADEGERKAMVNQLSGGKPGGRKRPRRRKPNPSKPDPNKPKPDAH